MWKHFQSSLTSDLLLGICSFRLSWTEFTTYNCKGLCLNPVRVIYHILTPQSFLFFLHFKLFNEEKCHSVKLTVSFPLAFALRLCHLHNFSVGGETNYNETRSCWCARVGKERYEPYSYTFKLAVHLDSTALLLKKNSGISFTSAPQIALSTPSLHVQFFNSFTAFLSANAQSCLWWFGKE